MSIKAWSDGSYRLSGIAIIGYIIEENGEEICSYRARAPNVDSSHEAEFVALIALIEQLNKLNVKSANVFNDSTSVVHQVKGLSKSEGKYGYYVDLINLLNENNKYNINWIKRKYNKADKLCKIVTIKNVFTKKFKEIVKGEG